MTTLAEFMILSGGDNRPPMLDKDLYNSWQSRMETESMETNIILQGLPSDVYALVNHHRIAKDLWERIQLLMQVNTKFLNSLPPEWSKFVTDVKLGFAAALAVLVTGASQSRQHESHHRFFPVDTSLIHIESRKSPTKSLIDVGSRRISIFTVNTKEYHSDVLAIITRIMRRT
ncbi:hypothetical protein Tco_0438121 [Tanacetum coccineum]